MADDQFDCVVVGAGLSGIVCAERLADRGKRVLIIEKTSQFGGNCRDSLNACGIYVHQFGPHIFHTDHKTVWDYLSRFTAWHPYAHSVLCDVNGKKIPVPFNLTSLRILFSEEQSTRCAQKLIQVFGEGAAISILSLRETSDPDLKFLADYIYENIFLNYTEKQWGLRPEEMNPSIFARVPVVVGEDSRYFRERYQGVPLHGYSGMLEKMLANPRIKVRCNTEARTILSLKDRRLSIEGNQFAGPVVYTGALDELFDYCLGALPYRSVDIRFSDLSQAYFQETAVINYPNDVPFTRITEYKYFQPDHARIGSTTISHEYPEPYVPGKNNPYYVVDTPASKKLYREYGKISQQLPNFHVLGRLGLYHYLDMDKAVQAALALADSL